MSTRTKAEPKKIDPRWGTAIHESGHAVMACVMRLPIRLVTIAPDDDSWGTTSHPVEREAFWKALENGDINWRRRQRVEAHIISSIAGRLTEQKFFGIKEEDYEGNNEHDIWVEVQWADLITESDDEGLAYLMWLERRTLNIMSHPRYLRAVKTLALELMNNQTLSGRQVREVLSDFV
jgi:hypothetical protein